MQLCHLVPFTLLAIATPVVLAAKEPIPWCKPCGKDLLGMCGANADKPYDAPLMYPINAGWDASYKSADVNVTVDVWEISPVMLLHSDTDNKVVVSIDFFNATNQVQTKTIRHQVQGRQECTIPTYPEGFTGKSIKKITYFMKSK